MFNSTIINYHYLTRTEKIDIPIRIILIKLIYFTK